MNKLKECINCGIKCDRSYQGCFNTALKDQGECEKCLNLMLEEHDREVRNKAIADFLELASKQCCFHGVESILNRVAEQLTK